MKNKMKKWLKGPLLACTLAAICAMTSCIDTPPPAYEEGVTVTFNYNDGIARPYKIEVDASGNVSAPSEPVREGYDFSHWSASVDGEAVKFPYNATSDAQLHAVWTPKTFDVKFDLNFEGSEAIVVPTVYNTEVNAPETNPEREGHIFRYWTNGADSTERATFPYTVTKEKTFYALWAEEDMKFFDVSFDLNYEGAPAEDVPATMAGIMEGEIIRESDMPTMPTRAGYEFLGWSESPDGGEDNLISYPYTPTDNVTLYAQWIVERLSVYFRYNYPDARREHGDVIFETVKVVAGETIEAPAEVPTRPGHTFAGWYGAALTSSEADFSKPVNRSTNYYAHWTSDEVVTDTFHAEFTYINHSEKYPGYSGEAMGPGIIICDDTDSTIYAASDYTPPVTAHSDPTHGHYVSYLYKENATLTFEIYSDKAVTGATLQANLAAEVLEGMTLAPEGPSAYKFYVNDVEINYGSLAVGAKPAVNQGGLFKCQFSLFTIGNINLVAGKNVIKLVTANASGQFMGGTMGAIAPLVDCIKIVNTDARLSYYPIYDNLWYSAL